MLSAASARQLAALWRYYQIGVINTLVGFSLFAAFVHIGLNQYEAQITAHLIGMSFNYVSYSRHAFRGASPAKRRFILAYAFNYLVSLAALAIVSVFVRSPYAAGVLAMLSASLINYFVLRYLVFHERPV